ncbi:hypothetical protein OXPF_02400 [Oxobacter pfennigii]|uniref:Uncharacterized protein n=1 Tax=Oxobacter pfennigii TaxID=36849 RepID=A0A0P8X5K6_9CLOT|nr:hypothetical protein [Oxobacter pfennigii]KPU46130.1 hypothetical protein OXPF_02400 [Oxobacter pfennigii]
MLIANQYKDSGNMINQRNDYMDSLEFKENKDFAEIIINLNHRQDNIHAR